jgi:RecB family exonuclease
VSDAPPPLQQRRLIRARDLTAFRAAVAALSVDGPPLAARARAVVVPTRAAAELLRQTLERRLAGSPAPAVILPDFLTRAELLERFADALPGRPRLLGRAERQVIMARAARESAARRRMGGAPFPLRPGLVAAMLDFYDELRRRQRSVRRLTQVLFGQLGGERGMDRGSEGLIHQTAFLGFSFLAYERRAAASGAQDEHALREALLGTQPPLPYAHVVVGVADNPSDPRGLWPADFDLLGRLRHLGRLDVVVTDGAHDAGFRDRIEQELPGIEEDRWTADERRPVIWRPAGGPAAAVCAVSRDREEELRDVARVIRARAAAANGRVSPTAIVFQRPLPYLYLSHQVLTEARVPYQAFDALPLAAEPYAALLDVVVTAARTGGSRESSVALLRSGLLRLEVEGTPVSRADASALDAVLSERRATGEAASFPDEVAAYFRASETRGSIVRASAERAARGAVMAAGALRPAREGPTAVDQVRAIEAFIRTHERRLLDADPGAERHRRARAAVLGVLDALAEAFDRHDPGRPAGEDVIAALRHAVEGETFTPRRGGAGVHLVDAVTARFGNFDHAHLVGLVETDWPERPRRNIFYTSGLLATLGWPQQPDQARVERAAFADLLRLPAETLWLSAFQREGDALVAPSPMVDLARDEETREDAPAVRRRVFDDEVLTSASPAALDSASGVAAWLRHRHARPDLSLPRFGGAVGDQPPQRYRISRVDRYVDCPFKYFAEHVLGLPEERDEAAGLTPLERGTLVHRLFEDFYRSWAASPGGAITAETLPEAIARFTQLTDEALTSLPAADRALERTRLLGSLVAPGVAERVFELEADAGGVIDRRLIEYDLRGPIGFPLLGGLKTRIVDIHGKADRIDVFADGSLRVIDYKLSRLPDTHASIQIAVYAHAARQLLEAAEGRPHPIAAAMYLAFGDEDRFEGPLGSRDRRTADVVDARVQEFAAVIDRIEAGEFPPDPRKPGDCQWCRYAGVCRKEYRAESDETAESV